MKLSTYLVGIPVVVASAVVAVANRQIVTFSLDPFSLSHPAEALSIRLPLFVLLLVTLAAGAILGGVAARLSRSGREPGARPGRDAGPGEIRLAGAPGRD